MKQQFNILLLKLQKFIRIDIRYLLSGGFFLSLSQVSSALISLGLTIAFANWISPETYGTYKYVLATYTLLAIAALPGVETAVLRSIAHGFDRSFISGVKLKMKWSLLAGAGSLAYALYNYYTGEETLGMLFILVAIALPFMETGAMFPSYFNGKKAYKTWTAIDIGTQIVSAISIFAALYFSKNLILIMIAYLLPHVIMRMGLIIWIATHIPKDAPEDSDLKSYAGSLTFFQILTRLITSIDQVILFHFLGPASVAIFSIANSIPNRIKGLLRITGTLAFPKMAKRTSADMRKTMPRKMLLFAILILGACGAYVLLVPLLFTYIFPQYHEATIYSQVLVFFTLSSITYPFSSYLFAHKRIRENYILAISSFIIKVVSLVIFVPLLGIWGAVISVLSAAAVTIVCMTYFVYIIKDEPELVPVPNQPINE